MSEITDILGDYERICADVWSERARQRRKWGAQTHSIDHWLVILGEEYGEACEAALEKDNEQLRKELIQVAAVAMAVISGIEV